MASVTVETGSVIEMMSRSINSYVGCQSRQKTMVGLKGEIDRI